MQGPLGGHFHHWLGLCKLRVGRAEGGESRLAALAGLRACQPNRPVWFHMRHHGILQCEYCRKDCHTHRCLTMHETSTDVTCGFELVEGGVACVGASQSRNNATHSHDNA